MNKIAATAPAPSRGPSEAHEYREKSNGRGSFDTFKKFRKAPWKKKDFGGVAKKGRSYEKRISSESTGNKRKSYKTPFGNGGGGGGGGGGVGMMPT